MPVLESRLVIGAQDKTGGAFAAIKEHIGALDKQIGTFDKLMVSAQKVTKANDPLIQSIANGAQALREEKSALEALNRAMAEGATTADGMAESQASLAAEISRANRVMVTQGETAGRVAGQIARAQERTRKSFKEGFGEMLPFAGPGILRGTGEAVKAGGNVDEEIARLKAAGATDAQIGNARADYRDFSKTHSGVLESDYLAGFRDARVIAPGEMDEMARLGATYRAAARNSGLSTSEADVGNVLRIMDELGLKTNVTREDFLNNFLKSQQAFGSQISTETALAAYRNAKQSIYDWSPEFRNKYFPTLLQSAGQSGGTEMMTALNNYIGGHMQQSELRALAAAGFVRSSDLVMNKVGDVRGLKPGAHLFESNMFKSNIAQWAWDFHDAYMKRKGATEGGLDDLIAKMPRNMAGLIAFLNHNRARIQRDAATLDSPKGLAMASDASLAGNAPAALGALKDSIIQLGAAVTSPAVKAAGPALVDLAHAITTASNAVGDFAKKHPQAATAAGGGAIAGALGVGGWLTGKLFGAFGRLLGLGGGHEAATSAAPGAAAGGGGGGLLGGIMAMAGAASLPGIIDLITGDNRTPAAKAIDAAILGKIKSWLSGPGEPMQLPGATPASPVGAPLGLYRPATLGPGRDVHSPSTGPYAYYPSASPNVNVSGSATVDHTLHVEITASPLLQAIVDQARNVQDFVVPLIGGGTGRMDSDAVAHRVGGIGSM